jgi:hypothetical protein
MMLRLFVIAIALSLALGLGVVPAESRPAEKIPMLDGLDLSNCAIEDGVTVLRYAQAMPASPYATGFDKREIFIASSNDEVALIKRIGAATTKRGLTLHVTRLASPPELPQIASRQLQKPIQKGDWAIYLEDIRYSVQGAAPGFAIECGTAVLQSLLNKRFIAASECFAYENKERFLSMLKKINLSNSQCQNSHQSERRDSSNLSGESKQP